MKPPDESGRDRSPRAPLDRHEDYDTEVVDLHEPIYREMAEPRDGYEPAPTWLIFFIMAVVGFGGWYLGRYSASFNPSVYDENAGSLASAQAGPTATPETEDPMVLGKRVYNNCMACHQANGQGVAGNYPPLDGSPWAQGRPDVMAALVLHGLEGKLTVHGETYNSSMPSWSRLSDEQLAAVLTYVRASWSNSASAVSPQLVAEVRRRTADRSQPWMVAELERLRVDPPLQDSELEKLQEAAAPGAAGDADAVG